MKTPAQLRQERKARAREEYLQYEAERAKNLGKHPGAVSSQEIDDQPEPEPRKPAAEPAFCVTEEVFDADTVFEIAGRLLGRELDHYPQVISLAAGDGEVRLVLNSKETGYYRVTEDSCTCKGWYFSNKRFGVGACRHHSLAFPADAEHNAQEIQEIKAARAAEANARIKASDPNAPLIERGGFKPFLEA